MNIHTAQIAPAFKEFGAPPPARTKTPPPPARSPKVDPIAAAAIETAPEFNSLINEVHALKRRVLVLAGKPEGGAIRAQQVEADFRNIVTAIRFGTPFIQCPKGPSCAKACVLCKGRQWLVKEESERIPKATC